MKGRCPTSKSWILPTTSPGPTAPSSLADYGADVLKVERPDDGEGSRRLGEDDEYVYKTLLEVSDAEYAQLDQEGHIGMDYVAGMP